MGFEQTQSQNQQQVQQHRFKTQQVQYMRMLEMPLAQIEQDLQNELRDNPALCEARNRELPSNSSDQESMFSSPDMQGLSTTNSSKVKLGKSNREDSNGDDNDETQMEQDMSYDDDSYLGGSKYRDDVLYDPNDARDKRSIMENTLNEGETLYSQLIDQINLLSLDEEEKQLMEYILGWLDDDGLLKKSPIIMAEELMIYQGIDVDAERLTGLIEQLKSLDPAGIGASSLQECLLIQVERRKKSAVTTIMKRILRDYYDDFIHRNWKLIYRKIDEEEELIDDAFHEITRLNPRPGAGLGEVVSNASQQITPDIIVETNENDVSFFVNYGKIPSLAVAEDFEDLIKKYEGLDREKIRKKEYEAYVYAQNRVKRAHAYIQLIMLRFRTLYITMKHIVERQKQFFLSGDDNDLKPLYLKDVAAAMDYDISTISRVCQSKYVQTEWGIYPMKHFFLQQYGEGEDSYTLKQIYSALREIIDAEDKKKPLSDDKIAKIMNEKGFNLARRTIAKHRERLGIKVARLRKE